jgi:hypothetical protein
VDIDTEGDEQGGEPVAAHQQQEEAHDAAPAGGVDIAKLTAKVYLLMLDELRLERSRGAAMRNT